MLDRDQARIIYKYATREGSRGGDGELESEGECGNAPATMTSAILLNCFQVRRTRVKARQQRNMRLAGIVSESTACAILAYDNGHDDD